MVENRKLGIIFNEKIRIKEVEVYCGIGFITIIVYPNYDFFDLFKIFNYYLNKIERSQIGPLFLIKESESFQIEKKRLKFPNKTASVEDLFEWVNKPDYASFFKSGEGFTGKFLGLELRCVKGGGVYFNKEIDIIEILKLL